MTELVAMREGAITCRLLSIHCGELKEETLVSIDVVSLFTSVPTDLAIRVACNRLESDTSLSERTSLNVDDIMDLLSLCLDATFLSFRGKVYRQAQGTAMGSPVSVVVANLMMEDIEERALFTFHSPPRFWKRYVDDTCTALHPDLIEPFHSHLNSIEPCVQFTVEKESDGRLAFLDIQLVRGVDVLWLSSLSGAQSSSGKDTDDESRYLVIFRCGTGTGREGSNNSIEGKWVPLRLHTQTFLSSETKATDRWRETQNLCDTAIYWWSLRNYQADSQAIGNPGGVSSFNHPPPTTGTSQRPDSNGGTERSSLLHSLHRLSEGLHWTDGQVLEAQAKRASSCLEERGCGSFCSCRAYMDNGPRHGSYQVNGTGLSPTHHHTMPPGKLPHPEKYWQPQQGMRNTPRGLHGSSGLTKALTLISTHIT